MSATFGALRTRFWSLYRRRAMVHHYTQYIDAGVFDDALASLDALIGDYEAHDRAQPPAVGDAGEPHTSGGGAHERLTPLF